MKQVGDMKLYSLDEVTDELIGKKDTTERKEFDRKVDEALQAYKLGEAIRCERVSQKLTQSQLGEKSGVMPRQILRMENGGNVSFASMARVFKALGIVTPMVDIGAAGKIALW